MSETPSRIRGAGFPHVWVCGVACGATGVLGAAWSVWAGLLVVPVGGGPPARRPRRELRSARRLEARPGPATAHGHRSQALRSLRRPPHQWCRVAVNSPARTRRRPRTPQPYPPVPPVPSTPVVPGRCGAARGYRRGLALRFLADLLRVVTNVVNPRRFSSGFRIRCYKRRQSGGFFVENSGFWAQIETFVTGPVEGRFKMRQFDDVCNVVRPPALRPGPPDLPVVCVFWIGSSVLDRNGASG